MLTLFIRWIKGTLTATLTGKSPERFINLCRNHCIYIWNIQKIDDSYTFCIYKKDYFRLKSIAFKTHTYPHISVRKGYPFLAAVLLKRKSLVISIIFSAAVIYLLSGIVWSVEISGQHRHSAEEIKEYLSSINVFEGMKTSEVDGDEIERLIRSEYNDISWVSVELSGCNANIKLMEADVIQADAVEDKGYSNIIASSNGIVKSIITRTGTPMVAVGDVVTNGQVLVSGIIDIYNDSGEVIGKKPAYADADIGLETRYIYRNDFNMTYPYKNYTGREQHEYTLIFNGDIFSFENILNKFESYEKYDIIKEYVNNYLIKKSIIEYEIVNRTYNNKEALSTAENNLNRYIYDLIDNGIKVDARNVVINVKDGVCVSDGFINVVEPQMMRTDVTQKDWSVDIADEHDGNNN